MSTPFRALLVEDSDHDAELILRELRLGGYDVTFVRIDTPVALAAALDRQTWDIIFSDYALRHFSGREALSIVQARMLDIPFIFVSDTMGEETAVDAMIAGAQDCVMKGNLTRLLPTVERQLAATVVRRARKQSDEAVHHLAYHDSVTNLPNRHVMYDRLRQGILTCHREHKPLAVLLMDLNRFKEVNDTFGHQCGDLLLRQIGPRVLPCLRDSDTVARIGGDEFVILLPNTGLDGARLTASKILKTMELPFAWDDATIEVGVSIGIALYPDHGSDVDALLQRADNAMYATKQTGGGFAVYAPEHHRNGNSHHRLTLNGTSRNGDHA